MVRTVSIQEFLGIKLKLHVIRHLTIANGVNQLPHQVLRSHRVERRVPIGFDEKPMNLEFIVRHLVVKSNFARMVYQTTERPQINSVIPTKRIIQDKQFGCSESDWSSNYIRPLVKEES